MWDFDIGNIDYLITVSYYKTRTGSAGLSIMNSSAYGPPEKDHFVWCTSLLIYMKQKMTK